MRLIFFLSLVACGATLAAPPAGAAGDPDAAAGLIADRCANCHQVPGYEARWERADLNAPSFEAIARDPAAFPPERMRTFLQRPHWPMTQFVLSPGDIDNILAFIARLQ